MAAESFGNAERLTGSDRRALLLWVLLGAVGALFAYKYFFAAFPEASVNFQVSRTEALERAHKFVADLGGDLKGYRSSIIFDVDENAKTYLERELGLEQANRIMTGEIDIWYWRIRFFRPEQKEEYRVRLSPSGRIAGYEHIIEEARASASPERTAAEAQASHFLAANYGIGLAGWDFLPEEANSNKRPNRLDWSFTWEKRGFRAKDAPYRLRVTLQGDAIGGAEEFLKVPEEWKRSFRRLRSGNDALTIVAVVPYFLLLGAAVWMAIALTRRGQAGWSSALKLGIVVAVFFFLMQLNQWPLTRAAYDTNTSYVGFVVSQVGLALLAALGAAVSVALVFPAGNALYRVTQPGRLRLNAALSWQGLRTKEFFNASTVGLSLAAAHIGFIVAFYMIGRRFGVWAPQELNYENSVSTAFPWISGIAIGLYAATSEEFLFRLFAVPFLGRITRSRWLAVILPAFMWSFLHSNYPQQPAYIRGIEVGVIGIVAGLVMLRWGILATLIWHYTVDALLVGLLLIRSNSIYFRVSGIIVGAAAVAPLAFAGVAYLLRGRFDPGTTLVNSAEPPPDVSLTPEAVAEERAGSTHRYDALSRGMIWFLAACLLLGGAIAWKLKPEAIGDYLRINVNAREARRTADEALRARSLHPESYRVATTFYSEMDAMRDAITNEYLRRSLGMEDTNRVYAEKVPGALWRVRYFRDSQAEEYSVILLPDGTLHAIEHTIAEAAPGASLSKEDAVARAETFLREQKHIDLKQWHLVEAKSDKRPHRTDHSLTWEENSPLLKMSGAPAYPAGEAHARIELEVKGDELTNFSMGIKIPEEWRRQQHARTLPRILYQITRWLLFVGLGLTALILYLMRLRSSSKRVPWRTLGVWGMAGLAGYLLNLVLGTGIADLLSRYPTEISLKAMLGIGAVSSLLGAAFIFGANLLLFGLAWTYGERAFGEDRLPSLTRMPGAYYRDAVWIALGSGAALLSIERILATLGQLWPTVHRSVAAGVGTEYYAMNPFATAAGTGLSRAVLLTGIVVLAASFLAAEVRSFWLRGLLYIFGAIALVGSWGSAADFAKQFLAEAVFLAVAIWFICRVMRFNVLGCFLGLFGGALLGSAGDLVKQPNAFYRANGYASLLALVVLFAVPVIVWRVRTRTEGYEHP